MPDGLILFPNSWKKYPKRAAAEGQKAKNRLCSLKSSKLTRLHRAQTGKISSRSLHRFFLRFFFLRGGEQPCCVCTNKKDGFEKQKTETG